MDVTSLRNGMWVKHAEHGVGIAASFNVVNGAVEFHKVATEDNTELGIKKRDTVKVEIVDAASLVQAAVAEIPDTDASRFVAVKMGYAT